MAEDSKTAVAVGAGALAGTALAIFLTRQKAAQAAPPGSEVVAHFDDEALQALLHILQNVDTLPAMLNLLQSISTVLGGSGVNPKSFAPFTVVQTTPGTPKRFPAYVIPFKKAIGIKAPRGNTGQVFIARTSADLTHPLSRYPLDQGETITLEIARTDEIWMDAVTANDQVVCIVERA